MNYHHHITPIRPRHRRRAIVAALVAICALAPAGAHAQPTDSVTAKWRAYDREIAKRSPAELATAFGEVPTAKVGDTPADFPTASRAPQYNGPSTVEVVRPERTIVHDADHALPIALAGLALLIALGGAVYTVTARRGAHSLSPEETA